MSGRQETVGTGPAPAGAACSGLHLSRARRLPPAGYRATFEANRSRPGRLLVLWWRSDDSGGGRVGTVASKRTLRQAVARNRARRLLREAYRLNRPDIDPRVDLVLVARARIRGASCAEVADDLRRLCCQAGCWRGRND